MRPNSANEQPLSYYSNIRTTLDAESQTFLLRNRIWGHQRCQTAQGGGSVVHSCTPGLSTTHSISFFVKAVAIHDPANESGKHTRSATQMRSTKDDPVDTLWPIRFDTNLDVALNPPAA